LKNIFVFVLIFGHRKVFFFYLCWYVGCHIVDEVWTLIISCYVWFVGFLSVVIFWWLLRLWQVYQVAQVVTG